MGLFRLAIAVFVVVGVASVAASVFAGGAAASGIAAFGALALVPLLVIKGVFLLMIIGFVGRSILGPSRGRPPWQRPTSRAHERPSDEERFEEWHRMAHAREEVDSWTPEL